MNRPNKDPSQLSINQPLLVRKSVFSKHNIYKILLLLIMTPLLILFLTLFVFQQYQVDGQSMYPTLQNNNHLIIIKAVKNLWQLTTSHYSPPRDSIIVFNTNKLSIFNPQYASKQLIKRVIALPGDRLVIVNGHVIIYNKKYPNGYHPDRHLPYGHINGPTNGNINMIIPANSVFVMGDNRQISLDSRAFGPVPESQIVGQLGLRLTPFSKFQIF